MPEPQPDNMSDTSTRGLAIRIRDLKKAYTDQVIFQGLSLDIEAGEIFVLMGPSGCGKSTFLKQLIGLEEADAGDIRLNDQPLTDLSQSTFRLAMVFQTGGLLNSLTVAENVGLYLSEHKLKPVNEIQDIVSETLKLVQLEANVGEKYPPELSGGMRKRVAIARAFTMDPQLVLYDEPTAELDPMVARTIGREIRMLNHRTGATTVVVTHDRDLALGIADRIGFLNEGSLYALGTPQDLLKSDDPLLKQFLRADFHSESSPDTAQ
jgi:phospholipid/cholesterol/gamma-HCH transport system ATP-binding protein